MATPIPENRAKFRLSEVAEITSGALHGEDVEIEGVITDSRAVRGGELFVALSGERFDGHAHAESALSRGARAVLLAREVPGLDGASWVRVADPLAALGALGRAHRERWGGAVVGVTGSAGKTGTKEAVAAALRGAGLRVLATLGNLNNRVGVPMTLLTLADEDVAVIEMGTSERGEIAALAEIARPVVGVVTLVDVAHTEGIGGLADVAREKGALFRALDASGVAIGSLDEPEVSALLEDTRARVFSFGRGAGATLRVRGATHSARGTRIECELRGEPVVVEVPLLGAPAVAQVAIALLVVEAVGGNRRGAIDALARMPRTEGRLVPHLHSSGLLVIDDAYNANPRSMRAALELALELARSRGGRARAVVGDMLELGGESDAAHEAAASFDEITYYAVGRAFEDALGRRGLSSRVFASPEDAGHAARADAGASDVVVVKGSRSMAMERALPILLEEESTGG